FSFPVPYHFCLSDYIDKQKGVGSVGSVGSICKDRCFYCVFSEILNQHQLILNQHSPALNQQHSDSFVIGPLFSG
ncbi:hypothetical protein, partial [Escherichia coli]|uniref:hypothetical protein n=3 Tax=Escherichia coli TaxID=562 RepID=UPI001BC8A08D